MKLELLTCAESSAIDQTTNQVSLFNIIEQIRAPEFPVPIPSITLIAMFERKATEPDELDAMLIVSLGSAKLFETPVKLAFQGQLRHRTIATLRGLVLSGPGQLSFELKGQNKRVGIWRIDVAAGTGAPIPAANTV